MYVLRSTCPKAALALFRKGLKGAKEKCKEKEMQSSQGPRPDCTVMDSRKKHGQTADADFIQFKQNME